MQVYLLGCLDEALVSDRHSLLGWMLFHELPRLGGRFWSRKSPTMLITPTSCIATLRGGKSEMQTRNRLTNLVGFVQVADLSPGFQIDSTVIYCMETYL